MDVDRGASTPQQRVLESSSEQQAAGVNSQEHATGLTSQEATLGPHLQHVLQPSRSESVENNEAGGLTHSKKSGGRPKSFVWQYYTQHTDANIKSKRCEVSCNYCGVRMLSRVEQMESHLAHNCSKCTADVKQHMRDRITAAKEVSKARKEAQERGDLVAKPSSALIQQSFFSPMPQSFAKRQKLDLPQEQQNTLPLRLRYPQVSIEASRGAAAPTKSTRLRCPCAEHEISARHYWQRQST